MWETMIGRQIRRSTRNIFIWNSIILIGITAFFAISHRYWYNFFLGPFPLTREELNQLHDDTGMKFYFTVQGDRCVDTGEREQGTTKRGVRFDKAKYLDLAVGDKTLVVLARLKDSSTETEWRGVLEPLAARMRNPAVLRNRAAPREVPRLPIMLNATITRTKGVVALVILIPVGLLNVVNLMKAAKRFANPADHPLAVKLQKYGELEDVAVRIDDEFNSADKVQFGPATLTRAWLIRPHLFTTELLFLGDAVWTYKTVTQHTHNGVPTGKSYAGNVCDMHGNRVAVALKSEEMTDRFVVAVAERVPWILAGYDPEWEQLWKRNKQSLYDLVDERRRQLAEDLRREREES